MAKFITQHHGPSVNHLDIAPWTLFFDGSSCRHGGGVGIVIISPRGKIYEFAMKIGPMVTNNQAEYEAILKGLQLLLEIKAEVIEVFGDSQLVINQLLGRYACMDHILRKYYEECLVLLKKFYLVSL